MRKRYRLSRRSDVTFHFYDGHHNSALCQLKRLFSQLSMSHNQLPLSSLELLFFLHVSATLFKPVNTLV